MSITCNRDLMELNVFLLREVALNDFFDEMKGLARIVGFHETHREDATIAVSIANFFGVEKLAELEEEYIKNQGAIPIQIFEEMLAKRPELGRHIHEGVVPTLGQLMKDIYSLCSYSVNGYDESRFKFDMDLFRKAYRSIGTMQKGDTVFLAPHWNGMYWYSNVGEGEIICPGSIVRITDVKTLDDGLVEVSISTVSAYKSVYHSMGPATFREIVGNFVLTREMDELPKAALLSDITAPVDGTVPSKGDVLPIGPTKPELNYELRILPLEVIPSVELAVYEYDEKPSYLIVSKANRKSPPTVRIVNVAKRSVAQKCDTSDYPSSLTLGDLERLAETHLERNKMYGDYRLANFAQLDPDNKLREIIKRTLTVNTTNKYLSTAPYSASQKLVHFFRELDDVEFIRLLDIVETPDELVPLVINISKRIADDAARREREQKQQAKEARMLVPRQSSFRTRVSLSGSNQ